MKSLKIIGNTKTCTSAVIIRNDKILLGLRHYTPDKWKNISVWTTPGGRCEEGELVGENLKRETLEEVGISDLTVSNYLGVAPGVKEGDFIHVFVCNTNQDAKLMEPEKFSEWRWFNLKMLPENFINPHIATMLKTLT